MEVNRISHSSVPAFSAKSHAHRNCEVLLRSISPFTLQRLRFVHFALLVMRPRGSSCFLFAAAKCGWHPTSLHWSPCEIMFHRGPSLSSSRVPAGTRGGTTSCRDFSVLLRSPELCRRHNWVPDPCGSRVFTITKPKYDSEQA
jgi:hypothetical protein